MKNIEKFWSALFTIKSGVECTVRGDITTEEDFNNNIEWNTGKDSNNMAITTKTNPHSEITWTKVKAEMDKL
tara:strand:+ start:1682 stop:1897 length:216 start_codon:yes stop_codon:yes gene_type:complete